MGGKRCPSAVAPRQTELGSGSWKEAGGNQRDLLSFRCYYLPSPVSNPRKKIPNPFPSVTILTISLTTRHVSACLQPPPEKRSIYPQHILCKALSLSSCRKLHCSVINRTKVGSHGRCWQWHSLLWLQSNQLLQGLLATAGREEVPVTAVLLSYIQL